MVQRQEGAIPWRFMLSQLGKNLRIEFDFATDPSEFVPASLLLSVYFSVLTEWIEKLLDRIDLRAS